MQKVVCDMLVMQPPDMFGLDNHQVFSTANMISKKLHGSGQHNRTRHIHMLSWSQLKSLETVWRLTWLPFSMLLHLFVGHRKSQERQGTGSANTSATVSKPAKG